MQGAIAKLLIAASTVLFVVVPAACVSAKADGLPPYPNIEAIDDDAVMLYPRKSVLDSDTALLEQVLVRTRLVMGHVVTYKTSGTIVDRDSKGRGPAIPSEISPKFNRRITGDSVPNIQIPSSWNRARSAPRFSTAATETAGRKLDEHILNPEFQPRYLTYFSRSFTKMALSWSQPPA
mgnify:CR=1 FL=1|jgi:hypothetical protein